MATVGGGEGSPLDRDMPVGHASGWRTGLLAHVSPSTVIPNSYELARNGQCCWPEDAVCGDLQSITDDAALCAGHDLSACMPNDMSISPGGQARGTSEGACLLAPELFFMSQEQYRTRAAEHHDLKTDHLSARAMRARASGRCIHRWGSAGTCARRATSNMVRSSTEM